MSAEQPSKRTRTSPTYTLIYHPGLPGRGEFTRLALEASGTPYTDLGGEATWGSGDKKTKEALTGQVYATVAPDSLGEGNSPPVYALPALRVENAGTGGGPLVISQTGNMLAYLGAKIGLAGEEDGPDKWHVSELALTALDWTNEAHDTHHPVNMMAYYEDQLEESKKRSKDFREARCPKFLGYFERVLKGNKEKRDGEGKYLVGGKLTYADTTLWQVIDGLLYAFPKELEARKKDYPLIFETFYPTIKEEKGIKEYLASERRIKYSNGIFRKYPELDRQ
ncbi:glutathione S-transferase [Trichodelitschia bisporula]|uniref:Glutathione S-transferase n=1 Tax=Trichodelitschia bisporula TaxID=703511 RepID=A0A6G1HW87_9PEZI|nr:glutathione S-transferase [Trichodelitschia bisporula]